MGIWSIREIKELKPIFEELLDLFLEETSKNQYSFISILIHTIDPRFPIYDQYVRKALEINEPEPQEVRRNAFWQETYVKIFESYQMILKNGLLDDIIEDFSKKRDIDGLYEIKKLDFIILIRHFVFCIFKLL